MNKNVLDRFTSSSNKWEYDVDEIGYKYNLTDVASAIGLAQLKKLFEGQRLRANIHKAYTEEIDTNKFWHTSDADDLGMHSHHLFQIRAKDFDGCREKLISIFEHKAIAILSITNLSHAQYLEKVF